MELSVLEKTSKSNKPYKCLELRVGEWSTLIFPRTKFEMKYIEDELKKFRK